MQLADFQIRELAKLGMIKPFIENRLNSYGYDMTLGRAFKRFVGKKGLEILDINEAKEEYFEEFTGDYVKIDAHSFVLGTSREYFKMPNNILGLCVGRSSLARWGLKCHVTPLEPSWEGYVTIEISNDLSLPIKIPANCGISQVIFFEGQPPWQTYVEKGGRYNKQQGVTISKGVSR